jgi:hypothetical protein
VVEFQVVENQRARAVVDELGALVEEGGVVLVRFHHEERRAAQSRRLAEIGRNPADQKARLQPGVFQNPGQQAAGGGLAVSAGHRQNVPAAQHVIGQPCRAGGVGYFAVEQGFDQRPAPAHHVADHHRIRPEFGELFGVVAFPQGDTGLGQLGAHRRIDVGVAAGNGMAGRAGEQGDAGHEGAADTENVNVHVRGLPARTGTDRAGSVQGVCGTIQPARVQ